MNVAVLGSGAGALAVSADLARHGREVTIADLPEFTGNLDPVRDRGGVVVAEGWHGDELVHLVVAPDVETAVSRAELVFIVVPCYGHEPFMQALAPILAPGASLLFLGEGGGSVVARHELALAGGARVRVGETNTLPYLARLTGPGRVSADRKAGGVLLSAVPSADTEVLLSAVTDVWPYISPASSVWETVLLNFNAIDHVATVVANVGTLESRSGRMLLWGEGASPSVVRLIEAVDQELLALRQALGSFDTRLYPDFLIEQGFAPDDGDRDLHSLIQASKLASVAVAAGPNALDTRFVTEDVPYGLMTAASIADEIGVPVPVISALISLSGTMLGRDFRHTGRTLARLGLAGGGLDALRAFAASGVFPGES
jgi:opine dehydrogenase